MKQRRINYSRGVYISDMTVEIVLNDDTKIPEQAINKALMIAMNYLIENMETEVQEEPE